MNARPDEEAVERMLRNASNELLSRLRSFNEGSEDFPGSYVRTVTLRNPDGPEAAAKIESLMQENADLIHDVERQMTIANIECNRAEKAAAAIQSFEADKAALLDRVKVLEEALAFAKEHLSGTKEAGALAQIQAIESALTQRKDDRG